jgi:hypothetical protein
VFVHLTKNTISPDLSDKLAKVKRPRTVFEAGGKAVQREISKHLRKLEARGNIKGWPSQKFFAGKATSVEKNVGISAITDKGVAITIADPRFIHRIQGGTVTAKRAKNIALPMTAEAYAASGKGSIKESMPGLKVVVFKRGVFLCRETEESRGGRRTGIKRLRIIPLFKLVKSVTHQPKPQEAPDETQLRLAGEKAMEKAADIMIANQS